MMSKLIRAVLTLVLIAGILSLGIRIGAEVVERLWPYQPPLLDLYRDVWPGQPQPAKLTCVVVAEGYWWDDSLLKTYCLVGTRTERVRSAGIYVTNGVVTKLVLSVSEVRTGELELSWGPPTRVWRYRANLQASWGNGGWVAARRQGLLHDWSRLAEVHLVIWTWSQPQ